MKQHIYIAAICFYYYTKMILSSDVIGICRADRFQINIVHGQVV